MFKKMCIDIGINVIGKKKEEQVDLFFINGIFMQNIILVIDQYIFYIGVFFKDDMQGYQLFLFNKCIYVIFYFVLCMEMMD